MKHIYTQPAIDIENVVVESGIATSPYGEEGAAGQTSAYLDYGKDCTL